MIAVACGTQMPAHPDDVASHARPATHSLLDTQAAPCCRRGVSAPGHRDSTSNTSKLCGNAPNPHGVAAKRARHALPTASSYVTALARSA